MLRYLVCIIILALILGFIYKKDRVYIRDVDTVDIDVVITYVDSNDEGWRTSRELHMLDIDPDVNNHDSNVSNRFRSIDELKYCLRSLYFYVPWFRNVYLVVSGESQVPDYIDRDNKRIRIIRHSDIIDGRYLPTFNSHAIEANIHKIKGLSNIFLYLNDDIFFGREIYKRDFLTKTNRLKFFPSISKLSPKGIPNVWESAHLSAWKNVNRFLDNNYRDDTRDRMHHCASILDKRLIHKIWKVLPTEMTATTSSKFRSIYDYALTCALFQYVSYYEGIGLPVNSDIMYANVNTNSRNKGILERIKYERPFTFCINNIEEDENNENNKYVIEFLEGYFPNKSIFEK